MCETERGREGGKEEEKEAGRQNQLPSPLRAFLLTIK